MKCTPISFLNDEENCIIDHLAAAMELYNQLCIENPQSPLDTFNFGHYIEAAKNAVLLRGARRMDPEKLIPSSHGYEVHAKLEQYISTEFPNNINLK